MSTLAVMPWIGILIIAVTSYFLIKRKQTNMVLLLSGVAMLLAAVACGAPSFLPKGVKPTGFIGFDFFELLRSISIKQVSGIGFIIMAAGGFAGYMDRIGAADALVKICIKPLNKLHQPYLVMVLAYLIGQMLIQVIPSAAGLAMLLLVALLPILKGVGVTPASAGAVIACTAGLTFAPTAGTANLAAKIAGVDPIVYAVQYQWPVALVTLVVVSIAHFFVQRYYDKKNDEVYAEAAEIKKVLVEAPAWYAVFPVLPIVLLVIFSKFFVSGIKLNTVSALMLVWFVAVIVELIRFRDCKKVFDDAMVFFKKMGALFGSIVALIICAEMFATGIKAAGVVDLLIDSSQNVGLGMAGMSVVLSAIVGAVTFLTGSGVGAYSGFAMLAPDVAGGLGGSTAALVVPMQFIACTIRAMSPVAGVVLAVAGAIGISPFALVRRTAIPMLVGTVCILVMNWILFI